jgi:hypothetical protein
MVRPVLLSGAKILGGYTLRMRARIMFDIAEKRSPDSKVKEIISKHVSETTLGLLNRLRSRGTKRKRNKAMIGITNKKRKRKKKAKVIKRDIFS